MLEHINDKIKDYESKTLKLMETRDKISSVMTKIKDQINDPLIKAIDDDNLETSQIQYMENRMKRISFNRNSTK